MTLGVEEGGIGLRAQLSCMLAIDSLYKSQMPWQKKGITYLWTLCAPYKGLEEEPSSKARILMSLLRRLELDLESLA